MSSRKWLPDMCSAILTWLAPTTPGQSWANLLGLGLLAPKEQLVSHIQKEAEIACAYDKTGECRYGQQTLAGGKGAPNPMWASDGSPSMNFDNAANSIWIGGATLDSSPTTVGAKAVIKLYHNVKNDIWDWKDLHMGINGKTCGATDIAQGEALAGEPFVNAHYARQLQGWMVQRALTGQLWNAWEKNLSFTPAAAVAGDVLPWFTNAAAGVLVVGGARVRGGDARPKDTELHVLEVHLGVLHATVHVNAGGRLAETATPVQLSPGESIHI